MEYSKIYKELCEDNKVRGLKKEVGYEVHHIIPRSLGGGNSKSNLVKLNKREHVFAHWLLTKLYPYSKEMKSALHFMKTKPIKSVKYYPVLKKYLDKRDIILHPEDTIRLASILKNLKPTKSFNKIVYMYTNLPRLRPITGRYYMRYIIFLNECKALGLIHLDAYKADRCGQRFYKFLEALRANNYVDSDTLLPEYFKSENKVSLSSFTKKYLVNGILFKSIVAWNTSNPEKILMVVGDKDKFTVQPLTYWASYEDIVNLSLFEPHRYDKDSIRKYKSILNP